MLVDIATLCLNLSFASPSCSTLLTCQFKLCERGTADCLKGALGWKNEGEKKE